MFLLPYGVGKVPGELSRVCFAFGEDIAHTFVLIADGADASVLEPFNSRHFRASHHEFPCIAANVTDEGNMQSTASSWFPPVSLLPVTVATAFYHTQSRIRSLLVASAISDRGTRSVLAAPLSLFRCQF